MKTRNLLFSILGGVVLLFLVGLALALTPAVQTWVVRKALADQPGADVTIGRIAAGLSGAEVTGLRWSDPEVSLQFDRALVRYSAFGLMFSDRIDLEEVVVDGFELDLRRTRRPATPAPRDDRAEAPESGQQPSPGPHTRDEMPAEAFEGVLEKLNLPEGFRLGALAINGRVLLPEAQTATLDLRGGNLRAGEEGNAQWTISFADASADAALRAARGEGKATLRTDADGRATRLSVHFMVGIEGASLPADRLSADLVVERNADSLERYGATIARATDGGTQSLLVVDGEFVRETAKIEGTWRMTLPGPALAAFFARQDLPEVDVTSDGAFALTTGTRAFTTTGTVQGTVARMDVLSPALANVEAVRFTTAFEARGDEAQVNVARFELAVETPEGSPLANLRTLQPVSLVMDGQRLEFANAEADLARVALQAIPLVWAQPFVEGLAIERGELSLDFAVGASADGTRVAVRSEEPLTIRNLALRGPEGPMLDGATFTAYPKANYAAGRLDVVLSDLALALSAGDRVGGSLTAGVADVFAQPATTFAGQLEGRLVTLLTPYVPIETGPLEFSAAFEGGHAGRVLDLTATNVSLRREGNVSLATIELRSPFALDLETMSFARAPGLAAGVQLGRVPLEWVEAFVPSLELSGDLTEGSLEVIMASPNEITANTLSPIVLVDAGGGWDGQPFARDLDANIDFRASMHGDRVSYDVRRLVVGKDGAQLVSTKAAGDIAIGGEELRFAVRGELDADAASLREVVPASYATLARGHIKAAFEATLADALQATAAVTARQLVARAENRTLGDLDLNLTLGTRPDGSGTVNLPLKLTTGGRSSDLLLEGTYMPGDKGLAFTGRVFSERLAIDDLQAFALLAPSDPPTAPPARPSQAPVTRAPGEHGNGRAASPRDDEPFWSGMEGRLEADIRHATFGPETTLDAVRGMFIVGPARLALETFQGRLNGNPFKFNGVVAFDDRQAKPYSLAGTAQVTELDLGAVLAAANPREKPAIETKVSADGRLAGSGANLGELLEHVQGTFDVKGSSGVLRALGRRGEAVGAVSAIVGLIGAARGSTTTMATAELASQLNELRFDSVTFKVERGADLDVKLTSLEFVSPTSRVTGTGTIEYRENVPLTKQPLRLQLSLAGKGALAQVLNRVGLLDGKQDEREYYTVSRLFTISGTPLVPDAGDFWRFVGEAALRAAMAPRNQEPQAQAPEAAQGTSQGQGAAPR